MRNWLLRFKLNAVDMYRHMKSSQQKNIFTTIKIFNISLYCISYSLTYCICNKDLIIFLRVIQTSILTKIYVYLRYFCQKEKLFSEETHFRGIIQRNTVQKYIEKYLVLEIMYADDYKVFIFWSRSSHFHKLLILQTF